MKIKFLFILFPLFSWSYLQGQPVPLDTIPFELIDNHMILRVSIEENDDFHFMFDTGAGSTLISASTSETLNLNRGTERTNTGAAGTHPVKIYKGQTIVIGNTTVDNVTFMADAYDFESFDTGRSLDGIIGFHILSQYVVEIDFDNLQLRLYDSKEFKNPDVGVPYSFELWNNIPRISATIEVTDMSSFEGDFLIDTGAKNAVIFSSPTVISENMVNDIGDNYVLRTQLGSSRKRTKLMFGRINQVEVFGVNFGSVPVVLSSTKEGILASEDIQGIIGTPILQRNNITFDFSRGVLFVRPSTFGSQKFETNTAGFSIKFRDAQVYIVDVVDRSPGDKAGLKNGDELVSINEIPIEQFKNKQIRKMFKEESVEYELSIRRKGVIKIVRFKTKSMI